MFTSIQSFFLPNELTKNDLHLARLSVRTLLISLFIAILLMVSIFIDESSRNLTWIFFSLSLAIIGNLFIVKAGFLTLAKYGFMSAAWLAVSYMVFFVSDGAKDAQILGFSLIIVLGGLLLSERGALIFTILSISAFSGALYVQKTFYYLDWINYEIPERINLNAAINGSLILILISVIQRTTFSTLRDNIARVKENEASLQQAVSELEDAKTNLEFRVSERTKQLQVANEVSRVAESVLDPNEIISRVINLITDQFNYYYAGLFLVDDNYLWANLQDATGQAGKTLLGRNHRLQIGGQSMVGSAIADKRAKIALDVGEEAMRFDNPLLPNTRSEIALPLIAGSRVLGALDVQSAEEAAFDENNLEILQNMANQVAGALENARLFIESQERLNQLNRLFNRDFSTNVHTVTFQGNDVTINPESTTELSEDTLSQEVTTIYTENGTSIAAVPVIIGGQTFGVIKLAIDGREWSTDDVAIFDAIASQAAARLENLQLIEETQKRAKQEQITNEITTKIRETLSVETILKTATQAIQESLELPEVIIQLTDPEQLATK